MCYAFKELTSPASQNFPAWSCQFKDPEVCEVNVAVQLAANGQVDPPLSASFDWNARQAELLRQGVVGEIVSLPGVFIPIVGPTLTRLVGLAVSYSQTDTTPGLCTHPEESTGECLFRHIADYLSIYVEEVLVTDKYIRLQSAIRAAGLQFTTLRSIIEPLGENLQELTRADVPESTRDQIDEHLANNQHSMVNLLNYEFMSQGTFFAPRQATYTTLYATSTFQIWSSQILFDPSYNTSAQVRLLVTEIDRVTKWVLLQMEAAKQHRMDSVATEGQLGSESNAGPQGHGTAWLDLKDDFDKCPWTERVVLSKYQCGRGCAVTADQEAHDEARLCLKLHKHWVGWSQDVFWREAIQVHLTAWEELKNAVLRWPTNKARLLYSEFTEATTLV